MQALYLLFVRQASKNMGILCLMSVAGLIAMQQFLFNQSTFASYIALGLIWIAIALYQASQCLPKNLNWILGMPISRQKVLFLALSVNLTIFLMSTVCYFLVVALTDLVKHGTFKNLWPLLQTLGSFSRYFYLRLFVNPSALTWANGCLIVTTSLVAFSAPSWRLSQRSVNLRNLLEYLWNSPDRQKNSVQRIVLTIAIALLILAKDYLFSPFGVFATALVAIAIVFPRVWRQAIILSRNETNFATLVLGLVVSCQIAWVYGLERKELVSSQTDVRVRAIEFLGPFSGPISQQAFAHILESSLSKESLIELSNLYLEKFHHGRKIVANQDPYLHFAATVASKDSVSSLLKAVELFDAASLSFLDLKSLFSAMTPLTGDPREMRLFLMMLDAKVEPDEVLKMLESRNAAEVRYGLVRARYDRDLRIVSQIEKNMGHFADEEIIAALHTLSLLGGEKVRLDDWKNFRSGRKLASNSFDPHCDAFQPEDLESLTAQQYPRLNICLRLKADRRDLFLLEDIEEAGWIQPPVNSYQKNILSEVFGLN